MEEQNNKVIISGKIVMRADFSHETYGEKFYEMTVLVKRLSGQADIIPVIISERLMTNRTFKEGEAISLIGQFRSYNKLIDGKSKLILSVFACEIHDNLFENENLNKIVLSGYVCKPPVYRTTPFNREICDVLIAVNRSYNKSDYIPCIAWGRNARFVQNMPVGEKITIEGRIQSREYQKHVSDDIAITHIAYEVSISKLYICKNPELLEV